MLYREIANFIVRRWIRISDWNYLTNLICIKFIYIEVEAFIDELIKLYLCVF